MALDTDDQFRASCHAADSYPSNLLRSRHHVHSLQSWSERLNRDEGRLFDDDNAALDLLEVYDGSRGTPSPIEFSMPSQF